MLVRIEPVHVSDAPLALRITGARREYKMNSGQSNHFLITVLVGLDSVADGKAVLKREFSTSWSPMDIPRSAARSREYALKTSLSWTSDVVDQYRRALLDLPGVIAPDVAARISKLDGRGLRLRAVAKELSIVDSIELDMVRLGIHWRNRMVHASAVSKLDRQVVARLFAQVEPIREQYRGLDIRRATDSADAGHAPRFKEVASIIEAGHRLVQSLDAVAIDRLDLWAYADALIAANLRRSLASGSTNGAPKLWPGNPIKSEQRIRQILIDGGFSADSDEGQVLPVSYLRDISRLTARDGRNRFLPGPES